MTASASLVSRPLPPPLSSKMSGDRMQRFAVRSRSAMPATLHEALRTNSALIELNLRHAGLSIDDIIALAEAQGQVAQAFNQGFRRKEESLWL